LVNKLQKELDAINEEKSVLEKKMSEESVISIELSKIKHEYEDTRRKKDREIQRLASENFGLKQQLNKLHEQYEALTAQSVQLESGIEISDEREFNELKPEPKRRTSVSNKLPPLHKKRVSIPPLPNSLSIRKNIKQEWMIVHCTDEGVTNTTPTKKKTENDKEREEQDDEGQQEQYVVLRGDGSLCCYDTENIAEASNDNVMTINLDVVQKFEHGANSFSLSLKNHKVYQFYGTSDAPSWAAVIGEFLPG